MSLGDLYVTVSIVVSTPLYLAPSFLQVFPFKISLLVSLSPFTLHIISDPPPNILYPPLLFYYPLSVYYYSSPYIWHVYHLNFLSPLVERKLQEGQDLCPHSFMAFSAGIMFTCSAACSRCLLNKHMNQEAECIKWVNRTQWGQLTGSIKLQSAQGKKRKLQID